VHADIGRQLLSERGRDEEEPRVVGGAPEDARRHRLGPAGARDRTDLERSRPQIRQLVSELGQLGDRVARKRDRRGDQAALVGEPPQGLTRSLEGPRPDANCIVGLGKTLEADCDPVARRSPVR
jgi:hypothetical protein